MKTTTRTTLAVRLTAASASAVITLTLFGAVVSVSEPQRSQLLAATKARQTAPLAVQLAGSSARLALQ